jgi:Carbohydrate binding module (family 6)/Putative Ig domain
MVYTGPLQFEAEHFDYKSIASVVTSGWDKPVRNYRGQGYVQFGTSASAGLRDSVVARKAGTYRLETRYSVTGANVSAIDLYVNGIKVATPAFTTTATLSDWAIHKQNIVLNAGGNTIEFRANGAAASSVYFDGIVVVPTAYGDGLVIQENQSGFGAVDGTIDNNYPGYVGAGFANPADTNGASIYWNGYFDATAVKSFTFRYASTNSRSADLIINGVNVASGIQFPATGSFAAWDYVTVNAYVPPGDAEVKLQADSAAGLPNIDSLELIGGAPENTPPTLAAIANRTIGAGMTLNVTNSATDLDTPAQVLIFSLLGAPTNAVLNPNSGALTWRPLVTQAGSANPFTVKVADNGTPSLSATQSFLVTVTNLPSPQITTLSDGSGALALQVSGASGPDYQVEASTNLVNWSAVFTTNSPALPFAWTNHNLGLPMNFFRIKAGPPF